MRLKTINRQVLIDGEWVVVTEQIAMPYEQRIKLDIEALKIEQRKIEAYLAETDIVVTKYRDQKELVELGVLDRTKLTDEEYRNLLQDRQAQRNLHNVYEQQIFDLENPVVNTEPATPYEEL